MEAAAKNLTPVSSNSADRTLHSLIRLPNSGRGQKIVGVRQLGGQCVLHPDTLMCMNPLPRNSFKSARKLSSSCTGMIREQFDDYSRIVSPRRSNVSQALSTKAKSSLAARPTRRHATSIPPSFTPVTWDDPIMEDEIFGPLLPS